MNYVAVVTLIALTILGEARTQPADGQACLAHTIVNRMVISGWSAEAVVFQPWQYLVWERGIIAPEYGLRRRWLICEAWGQFPKNPWCMEPLLIIGPEEDWRKVYGVATAVLGGAEPPSGCEGVTNYDNLAFWGGADPPWAVDMERATCVGDHCFYRNNIKEKMDASEIGRRLYSIRRSRSLGMAYAARKSPD